LEKIWATRWVTNDGSFVGLLERNLREYLGVERLNLVSNGTLALHLALKALDLKGEVITTPFTFAATTNVIMWEGLTPVFSDIDAQTFNIDPVEVEKRINKKTSAILAVHTFGNPCDVEILKEISEKNNIKLIYDAASAFGVQCMNRSVLAFGDVSTLSFHATKIYTTCEGGAIVCKDEKIQKKIKLLSNHGISSEDEVLVPGTNAKMDEFQAAMGLCNLKTVSENIRQRNTIYEYYKENLAGLVQFQKLTSTKYNFSYMPVCFESKAERDNVYSELKKNSFESRKYFFPLTSNYTYFDKSREKDLSNLKKAIAISSRILCLPIYPDLEIANVNKIVEIIKDLKKNKS
jgi:dTDP-4-amino-4,6-dideoxygalactose transaminase